MISIHTLAQGGVHTIPGVNSEQLSQHNFTYSLVFFIADTTIIAVVHKINHALKADRVLVLDNGSLVEDGAPHDLLENKDTSHFAALLRSYNSKV